MKKALFTTGIAFMLMSFMPSNLDPILGGTPIPLSLVGNDDEDLYSEVHRDSVDVPTVSLDDHTLYFADAFSEVVAIELKDASGAVVYSTNLPIGTQTLVLPATLSGTYTIYIYVGGLCYYGQITL